MFANIKNGQISKRAFVYQKKKKVCESFLKILWREGFIVGFLRSKKNSDSLKIFLKYTNGKPAVNSIKLITKPGRQVFYNTRQIWKINSYESCLVFSTNKGFKTLSECKKLKIGGKPFLFIN